MFSELVPLVTCDFPIRVVGWKHATLAFSLSLLERAEEPLRVGQQVNRSPSQQLLYLLEKQA